MIQEHKEMTGMMRNRWFRVRIRLGKTLLGVTSIFIHIFLGMNICFLAQKYTAVLTVGIVIVCLAAARLERKLWKERKEKNKHS